MIRRIKFFGFVVVSLMVLIVVTSCSGTGPATSTPAAKVFKVGGIFAMSGAGEFVGKQHSQNTTMAIDEINKSGELPFKIELVITDHKTGDVNAGTTAMRKLVDINKVNVVFASWNNIVPAVMPIAQENNIPVFNGGGVVPQLLNVPWLHSDVLIDDQAAIPQVKYLRDKLGVKKLAIIHWNDPGGENTVAAVKAANLGVDVVADIGHEPYLTDYRSEIAKIKAANPDGLEILSYSADIGYIVKQAREAGLNIPITAGTAFDAPAIAAGGTSLEGIYLVSDYVNPETTVPFARKYIDNYKAGFNEDPQQQGPGYYELGYVLRDIIKYVLSKGGDPFDGKQLDQAVTSIKTFSSVYGNGQMQLMPDGSVIKPVGIRIFKSGQQQLLEEITPPQPAGLLVK